MKAWKVILATLVIFCAGLVVGGLMEKRIAAAATPPVSMSRPGQTRLTSLLHRMDRELALTPEQHAQIEKIVSGCQERTRELYRPVGLEISRQTASACEQIREVLTPEQQAKFDTFSKTRAPRGDRGDRGGTDDFGKRRDSRDFDPDGATNFGSSGN